MRSAFRSIRYSGFHYNSDEPHQAGVLYQTFVNQPHWHRQVLIMYKIDDVGVITMKTFLMQGLREGKEVSEKKLIFFQISREKKALFFLFLRFSESGCFLFNSCLILSFSNGMWIGWVFDQVEWCFISWCIGSVLVVTWCDESERNEVNELVQQRGGAEAVRFGSIVFVGDQHLQLGEFGSGRTQIETQHKPSRFSKSKVEIKNGKIKS